MAVSKVVLNGRTLIDVTQDTVASANLLTGNTATKNDGTKVNGAYTAPTIEPLSVTVNGTYTASSGSAYNPVTVNVGGGGGSSAEEKQVNFIDYDGTILYSYTAAEANALTELPANPTHNGLTAQGWNWTLAQIKAQLTAIPDGPVWVGQMYITTSGDTEIDVLFPDSARLSPILTIAVNGTVTVNWGDGTTADMVTGTSDGTTLVVSHSYVLTGSYTITIHVISGSFTFFGGSSYTLLRKNTVLNESRVYANCVQAIRFGSGVTKISEYAFQACASLVSVTIPREVTLISQYAFNMCVSLRSVTIPSEVKTITNRLFYNCYSLASVAIPSGVTYITIYAFNMCVSLRSVTIPKDITSSIESSVFSSCYSLALVRIPSNIGVINNMTFQSCYSLASVVIPSNVTSIAAQAFYNCFGVAEYHVERATPPTLSNINAFNGIASDCVIYVPYSEDHSILNAYKTATNWSNYANYMQEEPQ